MKIALGCDHGGYELKELVKEHLKERNIEFEDFGTYSAASCHYPEFGYKAAKAVADGLCDRGIVICTTGIGISITANKVRGIRCALCSDPWSAEMTRRHNDANMLALGASVIGKGVALKIVDTFLDTAFEGGRHQTRVDMIHECERNG
ncbi:MAG: ribose 5-phosphate isomerase B [Oscillospiraceae bacterium]|nr:ribose 5-phosphate isomerase B [Oscillospiraceae bacterium]